MYPCTSEAELHYRIRRPTHQRLAKHSMPHFACKSVRTQNRRPIVPPFLADGAILLGGTKSERIFRVPGDLDAAPALKMRLDHRSYTLEVSTSRTYWRWCSSPGC